MPLPTDETTLKTATEIVEQLQGIFGKHPGFRPAHAKGQLLSGTFTPSPTASTLSTAVHFNQPSTPVWIRFSNSTGLPTIPDTDPNASPRGIGIRFHLGDRKHTDIIAHSTPFFPARTGADFLALFQAIAASGPDAPHPTPVEQHLGANPSALAFITAPKPLPVSYATEKYWAVSAFKLIAEGGKETFVRYQVEPSKGVEVLSEEAKGGKSPDFLREELEGRLPFEFKILAQVAKEGDMVDDATVHWPESNEIVELGRFVIDKLVEDSEKEQKYVIFDPVPRVEGVEASADPLFEMRAAVYLLSGRQRRAA